MIKQGRPGGETESPDVQQAKCPPQLVKPKIEEPWIGVNNPPPTTRTGWQVRNSLMVGDRGWITQYGIYRDAEFGLWCEGTVMVRQEREDWRAHIERTPHGVRVLEWPVENGNGCPILIQLKASPYGMGDCWVVEFPRLAGDTQHEVRKGESAMTGHDCTRDELMASVDRDFAAMSLDGIPWYKAEIPSRWHRCKAQTRGYVNDFVPVERCACGAIRSGEGDRWVEKNSRRSKR